MFTMQTPDDEDQRRRCENADSDLMAKVHARMAERDEAIERITPENLHGLLLDGDAVGLEAW